MGPRPRAGGIQTPDLPPHPPKQKKPWFSADVQEEKERQGHSGRWETEQWMASNMAEPRKPDAKPFTGKPKTGPGLPATCPCIHSGKE